MAEFHYRGYKCCYYVYGEEHREKGQILILTENNLYPSIQNMLNHFRWNYCVVQLDFLGCGQSDKDSAFVSDLWHDRAMQIREFSWQTKMDKLVLAAVGEDHCRTAAELLREAPELVHMIVTDESSWNLAKSFVPAAAEEQLAEKVRLITPSMWNGRGELPWEVLASACEQYMDGEADACPYCGAPMQRGYISGYRGAAAFFLFKHDWSTAGAVLEDDNEIKLQDVRPEGFVQKYLFNNNPDTMVKTAFVCRSCGRMVADISMNLK